MRLTCRALPPLFACLLPVALAVAATVRPVELSTPLHNPHMGWAIVEYTDSPDMGTRRKWAKGEVPYPWYDGVQVLFTWAAVEKKPGVYDWSAVDRVVKYWVAEGKTIHIIASTEYYAPRPALAGCPEWLYKMGVPRYRPPGRDGSYPDYTNPLYQKRLRMFMQHFADHFCNNPHVELIALRGYGTFGEWHSGYPYRTVAEREKALRAVFSIWRKAVDGRRWLMLSVSYEWLPPGRHDNPGVLPRGTSIYDQFGPTYHDYLTRSIFDYAFRFPMIGAKRDGVAGAVFQKYDGRLLANLFAFYPRRPIFCEPFGGYNAYTGPSVVGYPNTKAGDDFLGNAVDEAMTYHPNWMTMQWGVNFDKTHLALVKRALKLMGYRFVLVKATYGEGVAPGGDQVAPGDEVTPGGELVLGQTWENHAMGRCYVRYPLAVFLVRDGKVAWEGVDKSFDQTYFVSGETYRVTSRFRLPADLAPGKYDLRIAMVDGKGKPALRLAIEGDDGHKRYSLGPVVVAERRPDESAAGQAAAPASALEPPPVPPVRLTATPEGYEWGPPGALRPHRTYLVTFRYRITKNPAEDLNTDEPGYFAFYAEGGDEVHIGESRWYEKAGQPPLTKTLLVPLRERHDYRLVWRCVGGGAMTVDDVRVEPLYEGDVRRVAADADWVASVRRDLILSGNATAMDPRRPPAPLPIVVASRDRSQVHLPDDWYDFLSTNPRSVHLEPNTVYTVWFDCAARPQIWQGDYLYLAVRSDRLGAAGERGFFMWTQRYTSNPVRRAYSFRTGPADDYRLVWGIKNGGYCEISRIVIVRE